MGGPLALLVTSSDLLSLLQDLVRRRLTPPAHDWFERAVQAAQPPDRARLLEAYTAVARRLGKASLGLAPDETRALTRLGIDWPVESWGLDELGRVTLLVAACAGRSADDVEALVDDAYRHGDNRERQAVLRALPFLPEPERLVPIGVDACRTSIQPVFEAIACENPFPARYFPELNFNQMVLKAVFTGVAIERIVGLEGRITPELRRMAADYASERRAAGRPVPPDLGRLTGTRGSER